MTLHTPSNDRDLKSFTHNWQENFYEIQAWLQKNYHALQSLVKEINQKGAPGPPAVDPEDPEVVYMMIGGGGTSTPYVDHDYEPLTNGDPDFPELVFEDGDLVMHAVTWT